MVAVVIVTYNRLRILQECLHAIRQQTRVPDGIIIINNGSTDGTQRWLEKQEGLILFHQENSGGAGGFYRGMKEAFDSGFEWIWLIDDDVFPRRECLSAMLQAGLDHPDQPGVLGPLVIENGSIGEFHRGFFNKKGFIFPCLQSPVPEKELRNAEDILEIDFISFAGMLINRNVIAEVGFPKKEYFIYNDDVEYSLRIKRAGKKAFLVKTAVVFHKLNEPVESGKAGPAGQVVTPSSFNNLMYFSLRNSLINIREYYSFSRIQLLKIAFIPVLKLYIRAFRPDRHFMLRNKLMYDAIYQGYYNQIDNEKILKPIALLTAASNSRVIKTT